METPETYPMTCLIKETLLPSLPLVSLGRPVAAFFPATLNLVIGCPLFFPMAMTEG